MMCSAGSNSSRPGRLEPVFRRGCPSCQIRPAGVQFDLGPESADAASIMLVDGGVALVNGCLHVGRRRLAVVHELAHYLFADEYTVDWKIAEDAADTWEARLDRFARAMLFATGRNW